jgi:hypothetical protein
MRSLPLGIDSRTILMTAAKSDQFAGPLPGGARPAFSYLALGGLRGWAANEQGQVTASSLVDYIRRTLSLSRDRTQTPELSTPATAAVVLGKGHEAGPDMAKLQREAAASSGSGFQVTNLPSVPRAEAPQALDPSAAGFDFRSLDAAVLDKYNAAFELDKNNDASPEDKAESWRQLAKDVPQYADMGAKRAAAWDAFAAEKKAAEEAKQKRIAARDLDWAKLGHFLTLSVIPEADKSAWSGQFVKAYMRSPGLEPSMAKALAAHVAAGPTQEALNKLALKAPESPFKSFEGEYVAAAGSINRITMAGNHLVMTVVELAPKAAERGWQKGDIVVTGDFEGDRFTGTVGVHVAGSDFAAYRACFGSAYSIPVHGLTLEGSTLKIAATHFRLHAGSCDKTDTVESITLYVRR